LAIHFAQRFGISNPSPRYVAVIATAFRTGIYIDGSASFGTGVYGDMAATFAAITLDREAGNIRLDADPTNGAILEPFLKIVRVMRSLAFNSVDENPLVEINRDL
jgi:uncharacterized protein (DUF1800 family)